MGGILMALMVGYVLGAVTWHRVWPGIWRRIPRWLGGGAAVLLLACVTEPAPAQTVDTVGWRYTDSVPTGWRYTDSVPVVDTLQWPPPVGGARRHEPAGFRAIAELAFTGSGEGGWTKSGGYRSDPTAPVSPASVLQFTHAARAGAVSFSPGLFDAPAFAPVTDLYLEGSFWLAPDYPANPSNVNKLGPFLGIANGAQVFFNAFGGQASKGGFTAPLYAQINLQGVPKGLGGNSASGDAHFGGTAAEIVRGRWYTVSLRITRNTYGQADGLLDSWLYDWTTGREVQFNHRTTLALIGPGTVPATTSASVWNVLRMNAIHGGGLVATPQPALIRWDHLYVSGR